MAWIMDTYSMHVRPHRDRRRHRQAGRSWAARWAASEATGRGCMITTRAALKRLGMPLKGARVAVQGFGNVGSISADAHGRAGHEGHRGQRPRPAAIYNPKGLDIQGADRMDREAPAPSTGYPSAEHISKPGAAARSTATCWSPPRSRTSDHRGERARASRRRSSAKAPTARPRAAADAILDEKGIFVIPDILANAGGVTVSATSSGCRIAAATSGTRRRQPAAREDHGAIVRRGAWRWPTSTR